jgi:hypothetical protein
MRTRSGFLHWLMNCELGMPEEEEAITTSGRDFESISARSFSLSSVFSGAFYRRVSFAVLELSLLNWAIHTSWMKSTLL